MFEDYGLIYSTVRNICNRLQRSEGRESSKHANPQTENKNRDIRLEIYFSLIQIAISPTYHRLSLSRLQMKSVWLSFYSMFAAISSGSCETLKSMTS